MNPMLMRSRVAGRAKLQAKSEEKVTADDAILAHTKILASNFHDEVWRTRSLYPSVNIDALFANVEYCVDAALRINAVGRASVANLPTQNPELQRTLAQHAVIAIAESWKQNPSAIKSKHIVRIANKRLKMTNLASLCPPVNPPVPMKSKAFEHPYLCPPIALEAKSWTESMPDLVEDPELIDGDYELPDIMPEERASWDDSASAVDMERTMPKISSGLVSIAAQKIRIAESEIFDLEEPLIMATPVKIQRSVSPELVPLTPVHTNDLVPLTPVKSRLVPLTPTKPLRSEFAETPELEKSAEPSCEISLGWLKTLADKQLITLTSDSTFLALSDNQLKQFCVWAEGKDAKVVESCQKNLVRSRLSTQNPQGQKRLNISTLAGITHRIEDGMIVGKTQRSKIFASQRKINGKTIFVLASDHPVERD